MSITFRGGSSHPRFSCGKEACHGPGKLKWGFAGVPPAQTLPHPLQTACFPPNTAKTSLARSRGLCWRGKWGSSILTASLLNCYFILSPTEKNADIILSSQKRTEKDCVSARKPDLK